MASAVWDTVRFGRFVAVAGNRRRRRRIRRRRSDLHLRSRFQKTSLTEGQNKLDRLTPIFQMF